VVAHGFLVLRFSPWGLRVVEWLAAPSGVRSSSVRWQKNWCAEAHQMPKAQIAATG